MISYRSFLAVPSIAVLILAASAVRPAKAQSAAHDASPLPGASSVVKPQAYVSVDVVPRGHDFEVAIEEGATIIRVGTAIFGARI